jgi:hypothetical protein
VISKKILFFCQQVKKFGSELAGLTIASFPSLSSAASTMSSLMASSQSAIGGSVGVWRDVVVDDPLSGVHHGAMAAQQHHQQQQQQLHQQLHQQQQLQLHQHLHQQQQQQQQQHK